MKSRNRINAQADIRAAITNSSTICKDHKQKQKQKSH